MAKFTPGTSGNPAGKKPGTVSKATRLRQSIEQHVPEILESLVTSAKSGDTAAAKLLLDRALPALRPTDQPVSLPIGGADLAQDGRVVLAAAGAGELTPETAAKLLQGLGSLARVVETAELVERLERLEAKYAESN
ncbi:hypothetical protein HW932_19100 [Allochromatium humboldtianum]|uniref:DUF5681 domain-containing protein n=1 Tax=Allochromatium humboldtianum TaxID=504901 RepID=A0A850RPG0_9GAMM|nr:DUF5681 domain-containing protein [Allochromatium humboldtianum]NVZ11361.1 hypothetical protein [Allochromatium humboldtianum]